MSKKIAIKWLSEPEEHDYPAAVSTSPSSTMIWKLQALWKN